MVVKRIALPSEAKGRISSDPDVAEIVFFRLRGYTPERIAEIFGWAPAYVRGVLRARSLCSHHRG